MNELTYLTALAHLPRWRMQKINQVVAKILEKKLVFAEFFELDKETWRKNFALTPKEVNDLVKTREELPNYAFLLSELLSQGVEIIPVYSSGYPQTLKENLKTEYAPPLLYTKGNKEIFRREKVAVVGSRGASPKALEFTKKITKNLVGQGKVIVSGFAKGIDRTALEVALGNGGQTIIVLPQGILTFASGFRKYYQGLIQGNLLVASTYHPKLPWGVGLAMGRNRYIYGLANNIYVAESNFRGGTWNGVIDGLKKCGHQKIYVRRAGPMEKCANNELIRRGAIGIDEELKIVGEDETNRQEHLALFPRLC